MVTLVVNPFAGKGLAYHRFMSELEPVLKNESVDFNIILEKDVFSMQERIMKDLQKGIATFVVVGGDGTLNKVAEMLVGTDARIIPFAGGTGNDFLKSLNRENVKACEVVKSIIGENNSRDIDVGYVKTDEKTHIFLNGLGIGFDADVLKRLKKIPVLKGDPLYFVSVILSIFKRTAYRAEITVDGEKRMVGHLVLFDIGNGTYLGGGFKLFDGSSFTDGLLSYVGIKNGNIFKVFKILLDVMKGDIKKGSMIFKGVFRKIRFISEQPVGFHTDGDLRGMAREFEIGILNKKVRVAL